MLMIKIPQILNSNTISQKRKIIPENNFLTKGNYSYKSRLDTTKVKLDILERQNHIQIYQIQSLKGQKKSLKLISNKGQQLVKSQTQSVLNGEKVMYQISSSIHVSKNILLSKWV